ncbi:hypothetical protein MTP99_005991 [Tenebrio molitor]|nr:hypothetical protein MTP99_005991 [Tenebrio molitor]
MNRHIFVLSLLGCLCACAKLPSTFKKCNRKQSDFNDCFFKAVEHAIKQLNVPMKEIGLPNLDPLYVPQMSVGAGNSAAAFEQNYNNITLTGFTKNECTKIEINFDAKTMHVECGTPEILMAFDYEFKGRILVLPINGKGPGSVTIINSKNSLTFKFEEYVKKGQKYMKVVESKFKWTPEKLVVKLENLFGDDKALNDNINQVFNDNWKELNDDVGPSYDEAFGKIFGSIANDFFGRISTSELFGDE